MFVGLPQRGRALIVQRVKRAAVKLPRVQYTVMKNLTAGAPRCPVDKCQVEEAFVLEMMSLWIGEGHQPLEFVVVILSNAPVAGLAVVISSWAGVGKMKEACPLGKGLLIASNLSLNLVSRQKLPVVPLHVALDPRLLSFCA